MPTVDLGTDVTATWKPGAAVADPVLTVTLPDGTEITPTVTDESNVYTATVGTPWPGRYLLTWMSSTATYTDIIDVWPADPRFIISLDDARTALRLPAQSISDDAQLRLYVAAATEVIEDIVGAVLVRTVAQKADGGKTGVPLWERTDDIISVTVNGAALTEDVGFTLDANAAIVYAGSPTSPGRFPTGRQNVAIVYRVGGSMILPNIRLATAELVRHLWQVGQQGNKSSVSGGRPATAPVAPGTTPSGFAVPNRVIELCTSSTRRLAGTA